MSSTAFMIFRSKCPTLLIPDDASIWSVVEQHARTIGGKPAFICGLTDKTLTFAELLRQAKQVCAGLAANGFKKGDIVILHSFNCLEYIVAFLALNRLGAICSPSSPLFNGKELANQIKTAEAVAIISHKKFAKVALEAAGLGGIPLSRVYTLGQADRPSGLQSIENLIAMNLPFPNIPPIDSHQVVTLPFSSGTTGRPKGVELTARAMFASGRIPGYRESKTGAVLGILPFFHIMMTMNFHVTLYHGKPMIVLPGFTPETFLRTVEKYKLDMINLAPPLVTFLAKNPIVDKYDLSHVKHVKSGGAPLGKEVERAVMERLGIRVLQGYGMTEFVGCGCRTYPNIVRDGSSGTLHPNTELRVKDLETGEDLPANKTGELLFRTPAMMKGYFKNPGATRAAFTENGFLRTGDLGYIDDDGFIFIVDRLKELIKYKGHQVAPAEVEDVVNSHPLVADSCCVRGHNLMTGEEIPKAFVVLKGGETLTSEALIAYVAAKVAGHKRVREVEFTDVIPKSLSGKILRRKLQLVQDEKMKMQRAMQSHFGCALVQGIFEMNDPFLRVSDMHGGYLLASLEAPASPRIFTSSYPDVPVPKGKMVWNMLELHARERGDKPAFVCGITDKVLTFAETLKKAEALSAGLAARGIGRGDTVILHSFNCIEYPVVFFALNRIGAVCSPSPMLFNGQELARQMEIAKATVVVGHRAKVLLEAAQLRGIKPQRVFVFGENEDSTSVESLEYVTQIVQR
ncbi:hypothetical protein PHYPSEUDO_005626 [Phytophthora pseudosyringae]|uniref:4-coumarate-CoA ligase n=1 Tax=Phytophthora pseudosyringae TaxID=221518 RepID=A0A8T1VP52_9STRA|nr:hypothetical protein PHYPSEUDO_005626 [Phytophthora pseudosyringae]